MVNSRNPLSLDMGWKVPQNSLTNSICCGRNPLSLDMGWKVTGYVTCVYSFHKVAIRFRWIWVGKSWAIYIQMINIYCRNPLSLDMGWKDTFSKKLSCNKQWVAIRFRWIWVGKRR